MRGKQDLDRRRDDRGQLGTDTLGKAFPSLTRRHVLYASIVYFVIVSFSSVLLKWSGQAVIFGSFWESGRAAGEGLNPYLNYPLVLKSNLASGVYETNLNPPATLAMFQVLALLPLSVGAALWASFTAILHIGCVLLLNRVSPLSRLQILWVFTTPVVVNNLKLGQIYTVLFALALGIWLALRADRRTLAGVLLGVLVAMKPNFALCGAALFVAGYHRPATIGALIAIALSAMPVLVYGPQVYLQWWDAVALDRHGALFPNEISLNGYLHRAGLGIFAAPVVTALALAGLALVWRTRPKPEGAAFFGLTLGIACAPLAWTYYFVVLIPTLVSRGWGRLMIAAAAITMLPPSFGHAVVGRYGPTTVFGTIYLVPLLLIGIELGRQLIAESARGIAADSIRLAALPEVPGES